jgi:hypothetical protein
MFRSDLAPEQSNFSCMGALQQGREIGKQKNNLENTKQQR